MSPEQDKAERRLQRERAKLARSYQAVFNLPEGRRMITDLLREGGILATSHMPDTPYGTAFNEGRRSLALHIVERLRWSEMELVAFAQQRTTEQLTEETSHVPT